jgi:hypothetical protein
MTAEIARYLINEDFAPLDREYARKLRMILHPYTRILKRKLRASGASENIVSAITEQLFKETATLIQEFGGGYQLIQIELPTVIAHPSDILACRWHLKNTQRPYNTLILSDRSVIQNSLNCGRELSLDCVFLL